MLNAYSLCYMYLKTDNITKKVIKNLAIFTCSPCPIFSILIQLNTLVSVNLITVI